MNAHTNSPRPPDNHPIAAEAEALVRLAAAEITRPDPHECLACFVFRQVVEFGCDGRLRFASRFRDCAAPRATAMLRRLAELGGHCDGEIFLNVYRPRWALWRLLGALEPEPGFDGDEPSGRTSVQEAPDCLLVRTGSTQPCQLWEPVSRRG
ncbi:DUF2695 domain-containing protein [Leucobacter sp. M11]|uniref:DUF2695 domain-containing protein n=1 Tax=Leucobacter sp. M11 TaxID=2993565 RepID=UPI002D800CDC|nr:DUF2695 domain-containing protein [Leucobacter sp. M11]MEB4615815.1 DUF2695 domain-containing protein [Leucobacter sp. M11]